MTTEEVSGTIARRSRRIQELKESQPVDYDDDIDNEDYESADEVNPRKRRSKQSRGTKRARSDSKGKTFASLREDFEDHYLFQALNDSESSIAELATDWVDQYEKDKDLSKKDIINLILNAVGCFTTIEQHDVSNNESASETVGEIQTFFKRQKVHEFYLLSKKNEYKHLKRNYLNFLSHIITITDEKGILYKNVVLDEDEDEEEEIEVEDGNLMEDLLIWLSSFSVSSVRALRFIATLSLFGIQTTLCKVIKKNGVSLESFKLQLKKEEAKKQTTATKKRIEIIKRNIDEFTSQHNILENFIQDIVNTTFIHRFKDIDHLIRAEAMSSLGEWMDLYPELLFKVTYLKYLGWVLSDANSSVRLQVIKTLIKLLRHNGAKMSGLRQFFERFESRIIEIAFHDIDHNVKTNALQLLNEVNKIGYLEDEEISKITSLIFQVNDKRSLPLLASFIQQVEHDKTEETIGSLKSSIEQSKNLPVDASELIKIHSLIQILDDAKSISHKSENSLAQVSKILFALPGYKYIYENLINYFLLDTSSIKKIPAKLLKAIELSEIEGTILFELIHGSLIKLKEDYDANQKKLRSVEDENVNIGRVLKYLIAILKKVETNESQLSTFIKIFQIFPLSYFENSNEVAIFEQIHRTLIKFFKNNTITMLKSDYTTLLNSLKNTAESFTLVELNSAYKTIITELTIEFGNYINDPEFEPLSPNWSQIYEDFTFKLLVLGTFYDITEFEKNYDAIKSKILITLADSELTEDDTLKVSSIFKVFMSIVSWKSNNLLKAFDTYNVEEELSKVPGLLEDLSDAINETSLSLSLRSELSIIFVDLVTILFNFFRTYELSEKTNLSNINRFRELELSSLELSPSIKKSMLYVFLANEAIFANLSDLDLDREDNEDVNFNSLRPENEERDVKWEAEKRLAVLTTKLWSLKKLGLLEESDRLVKRIKLNESELGELFQSIVNEEDEEEDEEEIFESQPPVAQESQADPIENDDDIPIIVMED